MFKKIKLYFIFVLLFELGRWIFMLYHSDIYASYPTTDWLLALWHGLPHDLTCAGYIMALPFVLAIPYIWIKGPWHRSFMRAWLRIVLVPVLLAFFVDLELYTHWNFRLDSTPLIYLLDNPLTALANSPLWALLLFPVLMVGVWWVLQRWLLSFYPARENGSACLMPPQRVQLWQTLGGLLLCGVCFVVIRGGVTTSTMNVGRVYFSDQAPLNHAATNPLFSLCASVGKTHDFARLYRFMTDDEVQSALAEMEGEALSHYEQRTSAQAALPAADSLSWRSDSTALGLAPGARADSLLTTRRPNIVLLILESFSGSACTALYPDADPRVMPNVARFYREGVGFTHFYANSFRTDRGVAAILASYPGQPTYSVMKDQRRCNGLQYLSRQLADEGYDLQFVHGGDVDFTNMKGFLRAGGIVDITSDADFSVSDRLSKWGAPDHVTLAYLGDEVEQRAAARAADTTGTAAPFFTAYLSLSSHEPFDVPYHHLDDPYANSVAYADSCIGAFVDRLRKSPAWDDLLIIGLPDHCFATYPRGIQNHEPLRYHIPMFWMGGAVARPCLIDTYGSQIDLAATLLGQMGIASDLTFSKDMLCDSIAHFAFYAFSDGFGLLNDSIAFVQDNQDPGRPLSGSHDPEGKAERWGKAYLQNLYDDLARR